MPTARDRVQVVVDEARRAVIDRMQEALDLAGAGPTISAMLDHHIELMRLEAGRITFTLAEADTLAAIVGGPLLAGGVGPRLLAEVLDAFDVAGSGLSSYGRQFGIDEDRLVGKLRGIGPSADLALRIAFATWWSLPDEDRDYTLVGLRIVDDVE